MHPSPSTDGLPRGSRSALTSCPFGGRRPTRVAPIGVVLLALCASVLATSAAGATPFIKSGPRVAYAAPPTTAQCEVETGEACYSPAQLRVAYDMGPLYQEGLDGKGRTIVLVDSFGSPTIAHDLAAFDAGFGLPAPPSLRIVQPAGPVPRFDPGNRDMELWAAESTLDVEYAHAMAPGASLVLAETPVDETVGTAGFPQIVAAEESLITRGIGDVISQSFGTAEPTFPSRSALFALRGAYESAKALGVTVLAASGDAGPTSFSNVAVTTYFTSRVANWPADDPLVTGVGGTQLHLNTSGHRVRLDNVWNDTSLLGQPAASGGGLSAFFGRPAYQNGVASLVGSHRGYPDNSMSAAVNGGAIIYESFPGSLGGYSVIGGTSEATPLFAGIVAIADQAAGHRLGLLNPDLYSLAATGSLALRDVTRGNTTVSFLQGGAERTVTGYPATVGDDLATGLGTVDGARLVRALAGG